MKHVNMRKLTLVGHDGEKREENRKGKGKLSTARRVGALKNMGKM